MKQESTVVQFHSIEILQEPPPWLIPPPWPPMLLAVAEAMAEAAVAVELMLMPECMACPDMSIVAFLMGRRTNEEVELDVSECHLRKTLLGGEI